MALTSNTQVRPTPIWLRELAATVLPSDIASAIPPALPDDPAAAWDMLATAGVDRVALVGATAQKFLCNVGDLSRIAPTAIRAVPERVARRYDVIPIDGDKRRLVVATANPGDVEVEQGLAFASGRAIEFVAADPAEIRERLDEMYLPEATAAAVAEKLHVTEDGAAFLDEDLRDADGPDASDGDPTGAVRRIAATLLGDAVAQGVSDIHLARVGHEGVVRFRIDGVMEQVLTMPASVYGRVISRIKVIGRLDISDRLRPQDGRARIVVRGKAVDLRLSTVPVQGADERMVIRLLSDAIIQSLDSMDMAEPERGQLRALLENADGLVLLTGPTGSGKTTTLHAALKQRLSGDVTIMTVENPVEYKIEGVSQVQVEPKQGLTFASVLRAMLRQDPDILLVGEIRDNETAETAAQAAMTGHLVLSTVHADDAPNALLRLHDLGLNADTLGEAFRGAAAQRLLRRLCPECKVAFDASAADDNERKFIAATGLTPGASSVGCAACRNSGFKGRLPIHQVFSVSPRIRTLIRSSAALTELRATAVAEGMRTLGASAATRIAAGDTTVAEALRVLGARMWDELDSHPAATPATHPEEPADDGPVEHAERATHITVDMATAAALSEVAGHLINLAPSDATVAEAATAPEQASEAGGWTADAASVAVVPFINMSADPENEYFADGITEDIITALSHVDGLTVAPRTSSFAFKGTNPGLSTIGRTLGVRTVLQGSVRRAGNRVRVTAQLMNAVDGVQLWNERFDRDLDDIFAIQDEIAAAIVQQAKAAMGLATGARRTVALRTENVEAYQLFLRGRMDTFQRSPAAFRRAIDLFYQALGIDPDYARAHAGIAEAYIGLGSYLYVPIAEASREAERALQDATRLDPNLAMVHNLWGQLKLYLRADWAGAGAHFAKALGVEPQNPLAHALTAAWNGMRGDLVASRDAAKRAVQADPLSSHIRGLAVAGFPHDGIAGCDAAAALAAHEAALAIDPNSVSNLWMSAVRLTDLGEFDEAEHRLRRVDDLTQHAPLIAGLRVRMLARAGRSDEALMLRDALRRRATTEFVAPAVLLQGGLIVPGDEDATEQLLRDNIAERTGPVALYTTLRRELEPLLDHPRLGPLVRQLTLWREQLA